jgi:uncharacterized membrane protein
MSRMTWYTFFKSIHVITAVIWVGGATIIQAYAFRILGTGDGKRQAEFAKDTEVVGMRVFIPASLLLFLAALGMMINLDWSWGQNWVVLALIAFGLSFASGAGFLGPESGRLAELIRDHGPDAPIVKARIRRVVTVSRVELVVLLTVILNMVVKPTGQPRWFWGMLVVMLLGVAAVIVTYLRGEQQHQVALPATE